MERRKARLSTSHSVQVPQAGRANADTYFAKNVVSSSLPWITNALDMQP